MTLEQYVREIADQMHVDLSEVSIIDGDQIGFYGKNILNFRSKDQFVKKLVDKADIVDVQRNDYCDRLEVTILVAMTQLKSMTAQ